MKKNTHTSGFTMVELLVALTIGAMVIVIAGMVFTQGVRHARVVAGEAKLVEAAAHLTDVLTYNIRPAVSVASPATNQLTLTNSDLTTKNITFTGTEIQLDGVSILQPRVIPTRLDFAVIGNTVQVSYELTVDTGSNPDFVVTPFAATTTISLRN